MLATSYLFLGGAGAGMLVVLCVLECLNAHRRFGYAADRTRLGRAFAGRSIGPLRTEPSNGSGGLRYFEGGYSRETAEAASGRWSRRAAARSFALPSDFFARSWPLCVVVLSLGILCLVADLGRPDRVLAFALSPKLSVMAVGAYALGVALLVAVCFAVVTCFDGLDFTPNLVYALSLVGIVAGLTSMLYTGVLLSGLASVLFWQTWLLPVVFALSSLSGGVALIFLAAAFVDARQVIVRPLVNLARVDSALIVAELALLLAYLAWGMAHEGTAASAGSLVAGDLAGLLWGGVVTIGLVLPFAMERFIVHGNRSSQLMWVAAAVLLGCFLLRVCIVGAGAYDAAQVALASYGLLPVPAAA